MYYQLLPRRHNTRFKFFHRNYNIQIRQLFLFSQEDRLQNFHETPGRIYTQLSVKPCQIFYGKVNTDSHVYVGTEVASDTSFIHSAYLCLEHHYFTSGQAGLAAVPSNNFNAEIDALTLS